MKRLLDINKIKLMAHGVTLCFLIIHILLFMLFRRYGVWPMMYFNVFSVIFYVSMFAVVQRSLFRFFVVVCFLEVVTHMVAAVYFTGWSSGFQTTLIGLSILPFCAEYGAHSIKLPAVRSASLGLLGMAGYLTSCVIDYVHVAQYPLPEGVAFQFRMFWGVVVFAMVLLFLEFYIRTAANSDDMLSREVTHDQLTGLPNRYFVADYLGELINENGLEGYWTAMVDIDDFKVINDTYGHNCGDFILREVSALLSHSDSDMKVSRWGGEEFLLFGRIGDSLEARLSDLDALRRRIMDHSFRYEGRDLRLTVTIGVAEYATGSTIREWINRADQRLYDGKANGKNQVVA